jgi:hypothetical protein
MREGEPGDAFIVIETGDVEISRHGRVVRTEGPGAGVGESRSCACRGRPGARWTSRRVQRGPGVVPQAVRSRCQSIAAVALVGPARWTGSVGPPGGGGHQRPTLGRPSLPEIRDARPTAQPYDRPTTRPAPLRRADGRSDEPARAMLRPSASRTGPPRPLVGSRRRGSAMPCTSTSGGWPSSSRRASGRAAGRRWSSTPSRSRTACPWAPRA